MPANTLPVSPALPPGFWRNTALEDMTPEQWDAICDGCGRCCLHKLREAETNEILWTNISCRLLDGQTCRCTKYASRQKYIPDCVSLTPAILEDIDWLPPSCAYRLLYEGFDLPPWHPLISGTQESVHQAGASVRGKCLDERRAGALEDHLADWPGDWPDEEQDRL